MNKERKRPPGQVGGRLEMIFPGRTIKRENNEKSFDLQEIRRNYLSRHYRLAPALAAVVSAIFWGAPR